jgi:hypothetical protein
MPVLLCKNKCFRTEDEPFLLIDQITSTSFHQLVTIPTSLLKRVFTCPERMSPGVKKTSLSDQPSLPFNGIAKFGALTLRSSSV